MKNNSKREDFKNEYGDQKSIKGIESRFDSFILAAQSL